MTEFKNNPNKIKVGFTAILIAILLIAAVQCFINLILMAGWNYIAAIFNWPLLNFWQISIAVMLMTFVISLFKSKSNN